VRTRIAAAAFGRGGWAIPLLDTEAEAHIKEVYGGAAAFLTLQVYRPAGRPQYATG